MAETLRAVIRGVATFLPGISHTRGTGGSIDPLYCYGIWLRHAVMIHRHHPDAWPPARVAELGPGDSLGFGLMALLSGASTYIALDRVPFASSARNLTVFDALVELLRAHHPIPGPEIFPAARPHLDDHAFPAQLFPAGLDQLLAPERVARLRQAISTIGSPDNPIHYLAPWNEQQVRETGVVDLISSQAVLEHLDEPLETYRALRALLAPTGVMSHQIDLGCHGLAARWNGHWGYADLTWKLIRGRRPFLINRLAWSQHQAFLEQAGFSIVFARPEERVDGIGRGSLASRFRTLSDADLATKGVFLIAAPASS